MLNLTRNSRSLANAVVFLGLPQYERHLSLRAVGEVSVNPFSFMFLSLMKELCFNFVYKSISGGKKDYSLTLVCVGTMCSFWDNSTALFE